MTLDGLLHLVARVAVRVRPPLEAKKVIDAIARLLPPLSLGNAMRVGQEAEGRGTCLTRALAVASRLPGSEVVLGTDHIVMARATQKTARLPVTPAFVSSPKAEPKP